MDGADSGSGRSGAPRRLRVAVVGAGPSGLAAVKELLEEGHDVACFERAPDIGGVFRFDPHGDGVWESCRLTSSAMVTTFSDFPPAPDAPFHYAHDEYVAYLRAYCGHFGLRPHLRFGCEVERVSRASAGDWELEIRGADGRERLHFDAVAVCSGLHHAPFEPELPGRADFEGEVLHASAYKSPQRFRGRRVVVVGGGESGAEIAAELAPVARECVLSMRHAPFVVPRIVAGAPNDYYTTRLRYSLPEWIERVHNPRRSVRALRALLLALTWPAVLAVWLFNRTEAALRRRLRRRSAPTGRGMPPAVAQRVGAFRRGSGGGLAEQFATKTEAFVYAIAQGRCRTAPGLTRFEKGGVRFADGTQCDADAVILCTGYRSTFPFLDIDVGDARTLFKSCFHTETGPTLALIGLVRPGLGSIPVLAEMQARWFALLCSGRLALPDGAAMREEAASDAERHRRTFRLHSDRLPYLVDHTGYMDDVGARIGCKPRARDLLRDPKIARAVWLGPFTAHQFRLSGPHAKPDVVRPLLEQLPRSQPLRVIGLHLARSAACKLLAALGARRFRAHLTLS